MANLKKTSVTLEQRQVKLLNALDESEIAEFRDRGSSWLMRNAIEQTYGKYYEILLPEESKTDTKK